MHVRWAEKLTQRMTKLMHRKEGGWESGAAVVRAVRAACAQLNAIEDGSSCPAATPRTTAVPRGASL
jgi:hypothetical protein